MDTLPPPIKNIPWPTHGLITLWFDNAYLSQASDEVFHVMDKKGFVAAISVPTSFICMKNYLSWKEPHKLQNKGWEIVSEGKNYQCDSYLLQNSPKLLQEETAGVKQALENYFISTNIFVTPCGFPSYLYPQIEKTALNSYSFIRIGDEQLNYLPLSNSRLTSYFFDDSMPLAYIKDLIMQAKQQHYWLILSFHQIDGYPYYLNTSKKRLKEILELVKESQLPVVIPKQLIYATTASKTPKDDMPLSASP